MSGQKVLICEDDEGIVDVARITLTQAGYEVQSLMNGKRVVDFAANWQPDLVLVDLWMPGTSGADITCQIKNHPSLRDTPVIIVSANRYTKEIAAKAGADGYLFKPFNVSELASRVRSILNIKAAHHPALAHC